MFETGLRIGEAIGLYVEDVDLTRDDERISVLGKGGRRRTVLLDDPALVKQLRKFLKETGYKHGPLFRAQKNGRGGPLRYQSVQVRWVVYCEQAASMAIRYDPELRAYYDRKRKEGKHHTDPVRSVLGGTALGAICRKLLARIYIILKEQRPYIVH